jgi:mono/diheme cytochrome c family protein
MTNKNLKFRIFVLVTILTIAFSGCSKSKNENNSVKFQQYYVQGEQLYNKHCSNCHQATGTGLGRVYPPLNQSDYMEKNPENVLCLMKNGIEGELVVNGIAYNQAMPGVPTLSDLEIADIATYIYNSWDHKRGIIEVSNARQVLNKCN